MTPVLFAAVLASAAYPEPAGADKPDLVRTWKGPPSVGVEGARVDITCRAFKTLAVVEHNDPGLRGLADVQVRDRPAGMKADAACARDFKGTVKSIRRDDRYVLGVVEPHVVLVGGDSFGSEVPLEIVDARTGVTTSTFTWFLHGRITVERRAGKPGLRLHLSQLQWGADAGAVKVAACPPRKDTQGDVQVGLPARIPDLAVQHAEVLPGQASCATAP